MPITLEKKDEVLVLRKKKWAFLKQHKATPKSKGSEKMEVPKTSAASKDPLFTLTQQRRHLGSPGMLKGDESHPHSMLGYCPCDPRAEERRPKCEQGTVHTKILRLSFDCPHPCDKN